MKKFFRIFRQRQISSVTALNPAHTLPCGTAIQSLHNGGPYFSTLLEEIGNAKEEILLEKYWFASDKAGIILKDALITAKTQRNVKVNVIADGIGSSYSHNLFDEMQRSGVQVQLYNPLSLSAVLSSLFTRHLIRRNHRKMVVIDRKVVLIGGINIGTEWLPKEEGGKGWRDVSVRIEGGVAEVYASIFQRLSRLLNESSYDNSVKASIIEWRQRILKKFYNTGGIVGVKEILKSSTKKTLRQVKNQVFCAEKLLSPHAKIRVENSKVSNALWRSQLSLKFRRKFRKEKPSSQEQKSCVQVITTDAWGGRKSIRKAYLAAINSSQKSITICNGYFIPDAKIIRSLVKAVRRGVEVKVIIPQNPDVKFYKFLTAKVCSYLEKRGVQIFEYKDTVLHSKVATFDNSVAVVGSYNLDPISYSNNIEIVSVIHDETFTADLKQNLENDIVMGCQPFVNELESPSLCPTFLRPLVSGVEKVFFSLTAYENV